MTNREKLLSVLLYEVNANLPIIHFGYWSETITKWISEGHVKEGEDWNAISSRLGFDFEYAGMECFGGSLNPLIPTFEERVIKTLSDGSTHTLNHEGVIELRKPGVVSIPAEIGHTLVDRDSWEEYYLPRLHFTNDRINENELKNLIEKKEITGSYIGFFAGSLYGIIRNWFGIEGLSYIAIDDEPLYDEMIRTVGDLAYNRTVAALEMAKKLGITFDLFHFWEDICFKTGPLVNPKIYAEKVAPYYKKITDLGKECGVEIFSLDCDGLIDQLLPVWLDNGINTMFPIEVGTWEASIAPWREKFGKNILGIGGMDKRVFALDKKAIDVEIERLKPLVALGGYIPCPDHRIPPDAKWEMVAYYCEQMRNAFA